MLCGCVADGMQADPLFGFHAAMPVLRDGDTLFGNLETPISRDRRPSPGSPATFHAPPGAGQALAGVGFSVVNLAHNHIWDFGDEGVRTTLTELSEARVPAVGIGRTAREARQPVLITTKGGFRIAFLAYTTAFNAIDERHAYVAAPPHVERLRADIAGVRPQCDAVVVSCHTGAQFNPHPSPETRATARAAIESGASVFLGHHPHIIQGIERIGDGLAAYSLGNFCAPPQNEQTRRTFVLRIDLARHRVASFEILPCLIDDRGRPAPADPEAAAAIRSDVDRLSADILSGRSDRLHLDHAGDRFFSQYVTSWRRELREGGVSALLRKFSRLRPYHWQLVRNYIQRLWRRDSPRK